MTVGAQVDTPYGFTASVRVALCEHAPARIVLPGPGNTLGGVVGQILARLRWRGIASREDVARMRGRGVNAFLVGEAFMRAPDPGGALRALFGAA